MEPTIVIGSIGSGGKEVTMHTKRDVLKVSFVHPVNFTGSFTTGNDQPEGEVMKLSLPNLSGTSSTTALHDAEPIFGKHLREAVAIVKDWQRNP
jgi:hypothetical protein